MDVNKKPCPGQSKPKRHVLLTGPPGAGKSTIVESVIKRIFAVITADKVGKEDKSLKEALGTNHESSVKGFITREIMGLVEEEGSSDEEGTENRSTNTGTPTTNTFNNNTSSQTNSTTTSTTNTGTKPTATKPTATNTVGSAEGDEDSEKNMTRIGFDVVNVQMFNPKKTAGSGVDFIAPLARIDNLYPRVGKYSVYVRTFERFAVPLIRATENTKLLIIDEIGKMELLSDSFCEYLGKAFEKCCVLCTLPLKTQKEKNSRKSKLVKKIMNSDDSFVITVTPENRDKLVECVYDILVGALTT